MITAVIYREFRIRSTSMTWMFFDVMVPLAYLLLFGLSFNATLGSGVASDGAHLSYSTFFLPGVLSMSSFGIAINTAYGFFVDRDNGMLYEFLTYPMTRSQFLLGKILFNCLLALFQASITVALGAAVLGIPVTWSRAWLLPLATVVGTAGWFFFLSIFAFRIRRNDMFNTLINALYFILMFASSIFYPIEAMPGWLRIISLANPLTWHTDVLRFAISGGDAGWTLLQAAGFLVFLLVSLWLAVRMLRYRILE